MRFVKLILNFLALFSKSLWLYPYSQVGFQPPLIKISHMRWLMLITQEWSHPGLRSKEWITFVQRRNLWQRIGWKSMPQGLLQICSSKTQAGSVKCMVAENQYMGWNGKVLLWTSVLPFLQMVMGDRESLAFSLLYTTDDF